MSAPSQLVSLDQAESTSPPIWDSRVVGDLMSLVYVRAVVFTNGRGRVLHVLNRPDAPIDVGKVMDVAFGAVARTGAALNLGTPKVSASVYDRGVVIVSRHKDTQVAVLADEASNLGNLLHHVRRIFAGEADQ